MKKWRSVAKKKLTDTARPFVELVGFGVIAYAETVMLSSTRLGEEPNPAFVALNHITTSPGASTLFDSPSCDCGIYAGAGHVEIA